MSMTDTEFAQAMKALSEPNRLEIVRQVKAKQGDCGIACTTVLDELSISQSTFSHHVTELREAGILLGEQDGRRVRLTLNPTIFSQIQEKIEEFR
ncbi:MAG: helix-turn-helix domain-containing protein [Armatimonadetes bacterium]|nr:helix-turn-helix domain-containing protein [Armatimonadota bacterium]